MFWTVFVCDLLFPIIMIMAGYLMKHHIPSTINSFMGYRTRRSKINQDTWDFAHEDIGNRWWKWGWALLIVNVIGQLPFMHASEGGIEYMCLVVTFGDLFVMVGSVFLTERALRLTFDENGNRRA